MALRYKLGIKIPKNVYESWIYNIFTGYKYSYNKSMKPGTAFAPSPRLLDQVREQIRYRHYSLSTEKTYLYWVKFFIRWHGQGGVMRHPRDMGALEVQAFLSTLAADRKVSASTHNQALSAILFLYREVLAIKLPWLDDIGRPTQKRRIPSVLTKDEVAGLLAQMDGVTALIAKLLYGTGMRLMEGMRLRVKDLDFDRQVIVVREAKGGKDRVVMLPRSLMPAMRSQVWQRGRFGKLIGLRSAAVLKRRMRLRPSILKWAVAGAGFGCFLRPLCLLIREAAWNAGTICLKNDCNGHSRRRFPQQESSNQFLFTPCATALPRIYCNLAQTFVPCRSFWGIQMCLLR